MLELLVVALVFYTLGLACGLLWPQVKPRLVGDHCKGSPDGKHVFGILKGAYGYCHFCPARRRFLDG